MLLRFFWFPPMKQQEMGCFARLSESFGSAPSALEKDPLSRHSGHMLFLLLLRNYDNCDNPV